MIQINKQASIYTQLSNRYDIPYNVVEMICNSPFQFINKGITNNDEKNFMLSWLFKVKRKKRYANKESVQTDTAEES